MAGGGGGGGAAPPPKQDELQPHPVKDQLPTFLTALPVLLLGAVLLGFQHYLVMLGTTVLIPSTLVSQMGGGNHEKAKMIQTLLFVAGLNTLTQTLFGTRLPAVIGGSYTFVPTTLSIVMAGRYNDILNPVEKFEKIMRGIQGALIVASTLQIVIGFSGLWRNIARFLSPLSAVPLVALTGFGLYEFGFPLVSKCVEIGLPQLIFLVIFSQYVPHLLGAKSHIFVRFSVILSVVIVWIYAYLLTVGGAYKNRPSKTQISCRTDRSGLIGAAPWIRVPYPFQWGAPTFDAGEAFAMMATSFVALVESTGAFISVARYSSATPLPPSILSRGVGWQGVGILFSGLFGTGNGSSVSVEIWSHFRFNSSANCCSFVLRWRSQFPSVLQFKQLQNKVHSGILILLGLYFNEYTASHSYGPVHTRARWFNDMINVPFSSEPVCCWLVGTIPRHHVASDREHKEGQGHALVGQVPVVQN
ncbi:hypothetical protein HYC85_021310 [Camellia sinensis]|uniref:Nucleobase-ascorbate transporter 8 n=1 Tax=Camellia sinensis TaxID=4442 RepID=A0A7J7GHB5_CAMSI|nr:hypothetical protein HYC85_021310 [Camellia sinensis]